MGGTCSRRDLDPMDNNKTTPLLAAPGGDPVRLTQSYTLLRRLIDWFGLICTHSIDLNSAENRNIQVSSSAKAHNLSRRTCSCPYLRRAERKLVSIHQHSIRNCIEKRCWYTWANRPIRDHPSNSLGPRVRRKKTWLGGNNGADFWLIFRNCAANICDKSNCFSLKSSINDYKRIIFYFIFCIFKI